MQGTNRLKRLRQAAGQTQRDIGDLLGVDQASAARYENGLVAIPDERKLILAAHFGVTVGHLMGWEDDENGNGGTGISERAA